MAALLYVPTMTKIQFEGGPWDGQIRDMKPDLEGLAESFIYHTEDVDAGFYQPHPHRLAASAEATFSAGWHPSASD
jgi:hypothetical protein